MIRSPLRYPGGKSRALKKIIPLVPAFEAYREPFVGGGSVFIYLKQCYPNQTYWINDLYQSLYQFWQASQTDLDAVVEQVVRWKNQFQDGKTLHRFLIEALPELDTTSTAAAFFVLNRITFSGTIESGGYSNQAFLKRFTDSSIDRLKRLHTVLPQVKITNLDYQEVVTAVGENVFIFLDPPYYTATKSALYGKKGQLHKSFDHEQFAAVMRTVSHKWLITYDDSPYIRELFAFANIKGWQQIYGMKNVTTGGNQKGQELFISNY